MRFVLWTAGLFRAPSLFERSLLSATLPLLLKARPIEISDDAHRNHRHAFNGAILGQADGTEGH